MNSFGLKPCLWLVDLGLTPGAGLATEKGRAAGGVARGSTAAAFGAPEGSAGASDEPEDFRPTAAGFASVFFATEGSSRDAEAAGSGVRGRDALATEPGGAAVEVGAITARSVFVSLSTFFSATFLAAPLSRTACVLPATGGAATASSLASFRASILSTSALAVVTVFLAVFATLAVFVAWLRARAEAALVAFLLVAALFSLIFILVFADAVLEAAAFRAPVLVAPCFVTDCFAVRFLEPLVVRVMRALAAASALFRVPADLEDFTDLVLVLLVFPRSAAEASAF